ncbi:MAG: DUF5067 domain-containing protein [Coprococcus sp.]|jgi:hypothetical protein
MRKVYGAILAASLAACLATNVSAADKSIDDMSFDELKAAYLQLESEYDALKAQLDPETETDSDSEMIAAYDEQKLELLGVEYYTTADGQKAMRVNVRFTNDSSDGMYAIECFAAVASQNDTELQDITNVNEDPTEGNAAGMTTEVRNGKSIETSYSIALEDDSPVDLQIRETTADANVLLEKIFAVK